MARRATNSRTTEQGSGMDEAGRHRERQVVCCVCAACDRPVPFKPLQCTLKILACCLVGLLGGIADAD